MHVSRVAYMSYNCYLFISACFKTGSGFFGEPDRMS